MPQWRYSIPPVSLLSEVIWPREFLYKLPIQTLGKRRKYPGCIIWILLSSYLVVLGHLNSNLVLMIFLIKMQPNLRRLWRISWLVLLLYHRKHLQLLPETGNISMESKSFASSISMNPDKPQRRYVETTFQKSTFYPLPGNFFQHLLRICREYSRQTFLFAWMFEVYHQVIMDVVFFRDETCSITVNSSFKSLDEPKERLRNFSNLNIM